MTVDSHQHFWHYHPDTHGWITPAMSVLRRDYLPADLEPELRDHGITGCVAVQAAQTAGETDFLLRLANENPFILGVVGWLDLRSDTLPEQLEAYSAFPKLKGLRHIVQDEPDDRFMLQPGFLRGIGELARFGLTYDILIYPRQLPAAAELARRFPQQRFILDHLAKPDIRRKPDAAWRDGLQALAAHPNVSCKLSGMVTEAAHGAWREADFRPFLDLAFEAFGPERLLFGSDWPVCLLSARYGEVAGIVRNYLADVPLSVREAVMGGNARTFYNLTAYGPRT